MHIKKASGETVPFSPKRLSQSLAKSGASPQAVDFVTQTIQSELQEGDETKSIYRKAFALLRKYPGASAARYKLKNAIMELGPTGFPFEQFIARILEQMRYGVKTGQLLDGRCVRHEVDVVITNGNKTGFVECKFRNKKGTVCDVKIPLYVHARFQDIQQKLQDDSNEGVFESWLVTNTRFTKDALAFGHCVGIRMIGWDEPRGQGLKDLIDKYALYPLTCLTRLTRHEKDLLLQQQIVLCSEVLAHESLLAQIVHAPERQAGILDECRHLSDVFDLVN